MDENITLTEQQSAASRLRQEIRHTERDITDTVHTIELRLSPASLGRQGVRKATSLAWQGTSKLLEYLQRSSVQMSLLGTSALFMLLKKQAIRNGAHATKATVSGKPAVSGLALAATAARAFLSGARRSAKSGSTRPGKKAEWNGLASAVGAALGTYWYRLKKSRI